MRLGKLALFSSIALALTLPAVAATRTHRTPTSSHKAAKHPAAKSKSRSKSKIVGQRSIDDQRATQIQTALIKAGYLTGQPSGHWDSASEAAMQKLQGDNGWQTKLVPDSRALIKLGLGPTSSTTEAPASADAGSPSASPTQSLE